MSRIAWPLSCLLSCLRRLAPDVASAGRCSRFANNVGLARYRDRVGKSRQRRSGRARRVRSRTPLVAMTEPTRTAGGDGLENQVDDHGGERQRASKKREQVFG